MLHDLARKAGGAFAASATRGNAPLIRSLVHRFYHHRYLNLVLADQVMVSGSNFLTNIMLARYLGLSEFGQFALAWMLVLFMHNMNESLVVSPMVSIGPQQSGRGLRKYYGAVFANLAAFNTLFVLALFVLMSLAAALFNEWEIEGIIVPILLMVLANHLQHFCRRYFFARDRFIVSFLSDATRYLGQIGLIFFLARGPGLDSTMALLALASTAGLGAIPVLFAAVRQQFERATLKSVTVRHWHFSRWLLSSSITTWMSGYFLTAMTGPMLGVAAVGAMRSTQNIVGISNIFVFAMENVIPVRAARRLAEGGIPAMNLLLLKFLFLGIPIVGGVLGVAAIGSEFWLVFLYGEEFSGYGYLIVWWAAIHFMSFLIMPLNVGLRTLEVTKPLFQVNLILMVLTLATFYPLIRYGGISGAMIGATMVEVIRLAYLFRAARKAAKAR